ncbi:unnamed protein product [Camellia sinensis]
MLNSEVNSNVMGNSGAGMPSDHKQSPLLRKIALRDVQNDNRTLIRNHPENSPILGGKSITDAINVSGTKRLTPECPLSPPFGPSLSKNGVKDHFVNDRRKFDSEPGKKIQDSMDKSADNRQLSSKHSCHKQQELPRQQTQMKESNLFCSPVVRPNHMASMMNFMCGGSPVPIEVNSEVCHSTDSKATSDQQKTERFIHLQKVLKQCDESNQRDYIQMLLKLSPAELSRHAVELEKKAIQLTVEEGKQMQRMKALNILGKSGPMNNPLLTTKQLQSKK